MFYKSLFSKRHFFLFLLSFLSLTGIFLATSLVFAQAGDTFGINTVGEQLPLGKEDIRVTAAKIIRIFLSLLGIIAVGLMLYAGFTWMTSGGSEDKIASAKKILINATIGLAIILASFTIVQFVLKSLQSATGAVVENEDNGRMPAVCANFADCNGGGKGPRECGDEGFVVKSLTPKTPQANGTGMTNVVVRAVFSRPLDAGQNIDRVLTVKKDNNPILPKEVHFVDNNRYIVEAFFENNTSLCQGNGQNRGCLKEGNYVVEVDPNLEITVLSLAPGTPNTKLKLQTKLSCGDFDNKASFVVNKDFLDNVKPVVQNFSVNGKNSAEVQNLARGKKYRISANFNDRVSADGNTFGGTSYLDVRVQGEPVDLAAARTDWHYYTGSKSSSNDVLNFNQEFNFGAQFSVPALYTFSLTSGDIDSNKTLATSSIILDGELCHNGRQDEGETGIDIGGACLGDGQCRANWQCISGECGSDGRCINKPTIRDIDVGGRDPGAWDAAPGSWVSISGNFFGEEPGTVEFGFDADNNGTLSNAEWHIAALADCNGLDVWSDRVVIVSVPNLPNGASTTVRIQSKAVGERSSESDSTTDDRGPKPGPYAGIFKISQNEHPGLCAIVPGMASSTVPVIAIGKNLGNGGNSSLSFGNINATIKNWSDTNITTVVPQNMLPGKVGIRAKVGEQFTNGVEFTVVRSDENLLPRIESISPTPTTTLGSLMTIFGGPFGAFGKVYFASTKDAALNCARTTDQNIEAACTKLDLASLPNLCGNTWGNTQIIGKVPTSTALGNYFVVVKNEAGYISNGEATTTFVAGPPKPGLCKIDPSSGVAPLRATDRALTLVGTNLSDASLFFWTVGSNENQPQTWLDSVRHFDPLGANIIRSNNGITIRTVLPQNRDNGLSMSTGPIKAKVNNEFSNSVRYSVTDCTLGGEAPAANYQCCSSEGPEKGQWKPQGFACLGESKSAGYIWRFTTGLIPHVPRVLEVCQKEEWSDLGANFARPSPSPSKDWGVGDACIDSLITLQFSMYMSPGNLRDNIRVYTCGNESTPNCSYSDAQDVSDLYVPRLLEGQENTLELIPSALGATHVTGTWYRVVLGSELRANKGGLVEFGRGATNTQKLARQRTLNRKVDNLDVAYYFDFKTGAERCKLLGAAITPPLYTARLLGVIQNPGYPVSTNFDDPPFPLYYYLWGRGEQQCSVIDVNGKGWEWKPRQTEAQDEGRDFAFSERRDNTNVPVTSTSYYKDVRAVVNALQNTLLTPVTITASINTRLDNQDKPVVGRSTLYIDLGDPQVVEWWPQCNESCINATVGVKFNRPMVTSTYRRGAESSIKIQKCRGIGENCVDFDPALPTTDVNFGAFDPFEYSVIVNNNLELGAMYQVSVTDQIKSLGRYAVDESGQSVAVESDSLIPKVWKFRTKMVDGICILDKVDVVPNPFVSRVVGQKTPYAASPLSSPNQCTPLGQRLNPWGYGWNWSTASSSIATVSHLQSKGNPPGFCTLGCLPAGSDVPRGQVDFLCGNGVIDPGEDCEIANANLTPNNEVIGVSCTLNCLRPGNKNTVTTTPKSCGNGNVDTDAGEECDSGIESQSAYCTKNCNWKGSSQEFSSVTSSLQCGNGLVGLQAGGGVLGEECDLGISLEQANANRAVATAAIGCSEQCLHQGTTLSREYCESVVNEDVKNSPECRNSITICGNSRIEPGEECEIVDPTHIRVVGADGVVGTSILVNSATSTCNHRCILTNICDVKANIHSDFTCERGTEGCSNSCTRFGSSPLYSTPSLCGDGLTRIGENARCEDPALANIDGIGDNPVQMVTAVGLGMVNPLTLQQETVISATATAMRSVATTTLDVGNLIERRLPNQNIAGHGQYAVQCGYEEYQQPALQGDTLYFNNCPNNLMGVGANTCCETRPTNIVSYPVHGAGIGENDPMRKVCLNTYISASFDKQIDEKTLAENVIIASLHPAGFNCASNSQRDISLDVNDLLALQVGESSENIFVRAWEKATHFFASVFSYVVHAVLAPVPLHNSIVAQTANGVWCTGHIVPTLSVSNEFLDDGTTVVTSTVSMYINDILATNTLYAVIMQGGKNGMKDIRGVGIRGEPVFAQVNKFEKNDVFIFETGDRICKIDSISVNPENHLFTAPNSFPPTRFSAQARTAEGQSIVTTPPYSWDWSWQPVENNLYTFVPLAAVPSQMDIRSKTVEGRLMVSAQAAVTRDVSENDNHLGKVFAGLTNLTSMFCENPWPRRQTYPYEDKAGNNDRFVENTKTFQGGWLAPINLSPDDLAVYFNFGLGYCADSGKSGDITDDLPKLEPVVQGNFTSPGTCQNTVQSCYTNYDCPTNNRICVLNAGMNRSPNPLSEGVLKKFLLFNNLNDDIIGVQIFANPDRLTAREWYMAQNFSGVDRYTSVTIDGYDAITDGNNFYINALNELADQRVHNNIYLFGINANAQENTRQVFQKVIKSLTFNVNIPERNTCYTNTSVNGQFLPLLYKTDAVTNINCTSDYACRNEDGTPTSTSSGVCSNAKTKFQRDWTRLTMIKGIQHSLEDYKKTNNTYPDLASGTYIPGYTNAHWPSWSRLLEVLNDAVPNDPINAWSKCVGVCANRVSGQIVQCTTDAECGVEGVKCVLPDDSQTCWSSASLSFVCPLKSNTFEYQASSSIDYTVYLPLEYFDYSNNAQKQIIDQFVSSSHYESVQSCGVLQGVSAMTAEAGACGNGIKNAGEDCDPPGNAVLRESIQCHQGTSAFSMCEANCRFGRAQCLSSERCGNGRVEGDERCDDGAANGSYGHCNGNCNGSHIAYCGNGVVDQNPDGSPLEFCDRADPLFRASGFCSNAPEILCQNDAICLGHGSCVSLNDSTYHIRQFSLNANGAIGGQRQNSCSSDCQSAGDYCGDGKLQAEYETCDDGNINKLDGCGTFCKVENLSCAPALPSDNFTVDNGNTVVTISYNENTPNQCVNTTGGQICRGMGLECDKVSKLELQIILGCLPGDNSPNCRVNNVPVFIEFVELFQDSCDQDLTKSINKPVEIKCLGLKSGFENASSNISSSCGNDKVEEGEICDLGVKNGVLCNPEYNKSCTYCAANCKEVLTRDPVDRCGNGKIDIDPRLPEEGGRPMNESCDIDPTTNAVVVMNNLPAGLGSLSDDEYRNRYNSLTIPAVCGDRGVYTCEDTCRRLVTNCIDCSIKKNEGRAIPKLSVFNVLTPMSFDPFWGSETNHSFVRINTTSTPSHLSLFGESHQNWKIVPSLKRQIVRGIDIENFPDGNGGWLQYPNSVNLGDYFQASWIFSRQYNSSPYDRGFGFSTSTGENGPWGPQVDEVYGLETRSQCNDAYSVYFNIDDVGEKEYVSNGDRFNQYADPADSLSKVSYSLSSNPNGKSIYEQYGSFFPYLVNNEVRVVNNEYVLSPAVPPGTFRVVVKWSAGGVGDTVSFSPILYNQDFLNLNEDQKRNASNATRLNASISYLRAKTETFAHKNENPAPSWLCTRMESVYKNATPEQKNALATANIYNYWLPTACNGFVGHDAVEGLDISSGKVYVHEKGHLEHTFAQAMTIVTEDVFGAGNHAHYDSPYAFFVQPVIATSSLPIGAFSGMNVTVEVYDYRENQIAESSIYMPKEELVYKLQNASDSSNGGVVKYWHVFNLFRNSVTNRYEIRPVREAATSREYPQGRTVTNFAGVLCGVSAQGLGAEPCNRDE